MHNPFETSFIDAETDAVQREHRGRLEMLCRGEQPEVVPTFEPFVLGLPFVGPYDREQWLAESLARLRENAALFRDHVNHRPFALTLARHDLHFPAAILGCPTSVYEDGRVWWTPLSQLGHEIDDFEAPNLDEHAEFREMVDLLQFVVDATEGRIPVEVPYVSEPLILAADLFGEEFLWLLAEDPERAERFLGKLTAFILDMRQRFLEAAPGAPLMPHGSCGRPMPQGYNLLYGCTTQLISGDTYNAHFRDRDHSVMRCGAEAGGIHLCGQHTQHCETWRDMPELKMVELTNRAADDLETYWRSLRPDQYIVFKLGDELTAEDALRITGGRRIAINQVVDEPIRVR